MKLLTDLYSIHSMSGCEKKMKKFVKSYIMQNVPGATVQNIRGNLYVQKGQSDTYPCVVAHLDQVQDIHDKDFKVYKEQDTIFAYSASMRRTNGLGADDKNGIWVALRCLEKFDNIKAAFFVGEEIGCVGSSDAEMPFFDDCRFVLQIDRRGSSDLITTIGGMRLASDEFLKDAGYETFGYSPTSGLMTDVEALCKNGLKVSCVNMSCGYYNPHTDHESTSWSDLNNCLAFVEHIIETCTKVYPCSHEVSWGRYGGGGRGGYGIQIKSLGARKDDLLRWGRDVDDQTPKEDPRLLHASDYSDLYDYMFAVAESYVSCGLDPYDGWSTIEADIDGSDYNEMDYWDICADVLDYCYS